MEFEVLEGTTPQYSCSIVDENGDAVAAASLDTLTITLFNVRSRVVINSRDRQNALNANNVEVTAGGLLTWNIQPADLVVASGDLISKLQAVFEWTWGDGKSGWHELTLNVEAVPRP